MLYVVGEITELPIFSDAVKNSAAHKFASNIFLVGRRLQVKATVNLLSPASGTFSSPEWLQCHKNEHDISGALSRIM